VQIKFELSLVGWLLKGQSPAYAVWLQLGFTHRIDRDFIAKSMGDFCESSGTGAMPSRFRVGMFLMSYYENFKHCKLPIVKLENLFRRLRVSTIKFIANE
jgi:hypothetical protein